MLQATRRDSSWPTCGPTRREIADKLAISVDELDAVYAAELQEGREQLLEKVEAKLLQGGARRQGSADAVRVEVSRQRRHATARGPGDVVAFIDHRAAGTAPAS